MHFFILKIFYSQLFYTIYHQTRSTFFLISLVDISSHSHHFFHFLLCAYLFSYEKNKIIFCIYLSVCYYKNIAVIKKSLNQ